MKLQQVLAVVNQPVSILIASIVIIKNLELTQKPIQNQKKKSDKIRHQENKNITEKLDSDNINEKNKKQEYRSENNTKKEKKKDEGNKR